MGQLVLRTIILKCKPASPVDEQLLSELCMYWCLWIRNYKRNKPLNAPGQYARTIRGYSPSIVPLHPCLKRNQYELDFETGVLELKVVSGIARMLIHHRSLRYLSKVVNEYPNVGLGQVMIIPPSKRRGKNWRVNILVYRKVELPSYRDIIDSPKFIIIGLDRNACYRDFLSALLFNNVNGTFSIVYSGPLPAKPSHKYQFKRLRKARITGNTSIRTWRRIRNQNRGYSQTVRYLVTRLARELRGKYNCPVVIACEKLNLKRPPRNLPWYLRRLINVMCRSAKPFKNLAKWHGIRVVEVNSKGTSIVCWKCGGLGVKLIEKRLFYCPNCGYSNRDSNAAKVIAIKALIQMFKYADKANCGGVGRAAP